MQQLEVKTSTTYHLSLKGKAYSVRGSQEGVRVERIDNERVAFGMREMYTVRIDSMEELEEMEALLRKVKAHFAMYGAASKRCPRCGFCAGESNGGQWGCGCNL